VHTSWYSVRSVSISPSSRGTSLEHCSRALRASWHFSRSVSSSCRLARPELQCQRVTVMVSQSHNYGVWVANNTTDSRQQTADSRQQTADSRQNLSSAALRVCSSFNCSCRRATAAACVDVCLSFGETVTVLESHGYG
jgi:hypothetical protein